MTLVHSMSSLTDLCHLIKLELTNCSCEVVRKRFARERNDDHDFFHVLVLCVLWPDLLHPHYVNIPSTHYHHITSREYCAMRLLTCTFTLIDPTAGTMVGRT